jgi:hypothetical protein
MFGSSKNAQISDRVDVSIKLGVRPIAVHNCMSLAPIFTVFYRIKAAANQYIRQKAANLHANSSTFLTHIASLRISSLWQNQ